MKKTKNYLWQALACTAVVGSVALVGCSKDDGYDLKNIDSTIGVELTEFTIPSINSTMQIPLNDLFDIEDSEIVKTDAEGNYIFEKTATASDVNPAHPNVDVVTIRQESTRDFTINIPGLNVPVTFPSGSGLSVDEIISTAVDAAWILIPANISAHDTITAFNLSTDHDKDIIDLNQLTTSTVGNKSSIDLELTFSSGLRTLISEIEEIDIDMPVMKYLTLDCRATQGTIEQDASNKRLVLRNIPTQGTKLTLTVKSLQNFMETKPATGSYLVFNPDSILLSSVVHLGISIAKNKLDKTGFKSLVKTLYETGRTPAYTIGAHTTIHDIAIISADGSFAPQIDLGDIGGVAITGLPDFLDGDNVRLVVANPQIYIDIESDLGLDGLIENVKLTGKGTRVAGGVREVPIPDLTVKRNTTSHFVIFDAGNENKLTPPEGRLLADYEKIPLNGKVSVTDRLGNPLQIGKLASLVYEIPDSIKFSADGTTTNTPGHIDLGHIYNIQPSYTFIAPLALNKGSYVIYNDSVDGWREDMEDFTLKEGTKAEIKLLIGEVVNQIPLSLTLEVTPKFISGTSAALKNKVTTKVDKTINASGTTNNVTVTITVDGKEAFEHLDGVSFEALAESVTNEQVEALKKTGQTLQFKKVGAKVTGSFVIEDNKD